MSWILNGYLSDMNVLFEKLLFLN